MWRFAWRDVVQRVDVQADGMVLVYDERTLSTDENFGDAFICLMLEPTQSVTLLEGGALSPGPPTSALQQACENGTELVVRQEARVDERRVFFRYRLGGAVDAYSDVVEWYWQILEPSHPPVEGYELNVTTPGR